jgi:NADH dehydrogenase FAD-containing subunit
MEISNRFPGKRITLVHSRDLLFPEVSSVTKAPHDYALQQMQNRNIQVVLGERIDHCDHETLTKYEKEGKELGVGMFGQHHHSRSTEELPCVFITSAGRRIPADIAYFCTGYV